MEKQEKSEKPRAPKASDKDKRKKSHAESIPRQKRTSSWGSVKAYTGLKLKKTANIEFMERGSEAVEKRIYKLSCLKKTRKCLFTDIIEPKEVTKEEKYIYELRSFGMYVFHVILVFWVIHGTFDLEANHHSIIVSDLITSSYFHLSYIHKDIRFRDIRAPQEIWGFLKQVMLKIIYPQSALGGTDSIMVDNVLMGVAQLRQVRVKKDVDCETAPRFQNLFKHCYGYFSEETEDTEPFGEGSSTWTYSINLNKSSSGRFYEYGGSGYVTNFSRFYKPTLNLLEELENNTWIRLGTRAVFLDFSLYCSNTNSLLLVKITFELMPWGSVIPTLRLYSIKLLPFFVEPEAFLFLGASLILLGYTFWISYMLFFELKTSGWKTLITFETFIDVVIVISTCFVLVVHIILTNYTYRQMGELKETINTERHASLWVLIAAFNWYFFVAAILLFAVVFKFVRYVSFFNDTIPLVVCGLRQVKGELVWFTIMNLVVLFAWSFIYSTVYGQTVLSHVRPMVTVLHLIFNHAVSLKKRGRAVTASLPILMKVLRNFVVPIGALYIMCISFQTYVALVVHGLLRARSECLEDPTKIKIVETILTRSVWILETLHLYNVANKIQEHYIISMNEEDFFPFILILRRYGSSRLEIRLLLEKYGIRRGDDLTIEELYEVYQDFWVRMTLHFEVQSHEKIKDDLELINGTMDLFETTVADLKTKVERLADTFLTKSSVLTKESRTVSPGSDTTENKKAFFGRKWKRF